MVAHGLNPATAAADDLDIRAQAFEDLLKLVVVLTHIEALRRVVLLWNRPGLQLFYDRFHRSTPTQQRARAIEASG